MKKYILMITLLSATIVFTSCGSKHDNSGSVNTEPIAVKVSQVASNSDQSFLSASGKIEAVNQANLSTRMMGFVNKIHVKVGDKVRKGQQLISINNSDLQAKKAQAEAGITQATAAFKNAEKDFNRFKNLFAENSASQKELDDMTARYEIAKANMEAAVQMKNEVNAQFTYVNISAPFSGVVTNIFTDEGAMANPGMTLIAVESPGNFEVTAMVPESDISKIQTGSDVSVMVKSLNKIVHGKVSEVSQSAINTGGQYLVKVVLDKTDVSILSGMYVTVQFPVQSQNTTQMVLVPTEAIVSQGQLSGIYTVSESNTAILRWLRLGRNVGDQVEVLSGLSPEETYIITAEGKLYNGANIVIQ